MKKVLAIILAALLLTVAGTVGVFAAKGSFVDTDGNGVCDNRSDSSAFVDKDSDGICDNRRNNICVQPQNPACGAGFTDSDENGICDNSQQGTGFVDEDDDGICDNRGSGKGQERGCGYGKHRNNS